ncbi:MAG: DUF2065 domain-containing protein [Alphaproteobacteria bacterium]|nr:DUF2065 domain-containing protein [Alphaproteobacteria bacterium]MCK5621743.1 DUF2065 domain-containing protein [Alphaproteobacteria bacterium]
MENGGEIVLTALALVLVIEGAAYALFPEGIKRAMAAIQQIPASTLRSFGLAATLTGVIIVWLIRR